MRVLEFRRLALHTSLLVRQPVSRLCHRLSSMDLCGVVKTLERMAPLRLAAPWDNVGLLVEPSSCRVRTVLLTNDLVPEVVDEAVSLGADLIVSYHPPIFAPLKALRQNSWKERVLVRCIERQIAVFSPHTSWDAIRGGVNDWLASCFDGVADSEPVEKDSVDPDAGMGRLLRLRAPVTVGEAAARVKAHLKLSSVRLALGTGCTAESMVQAVAVCAGSGGSVLKGVAGVELYLTGEMSHHEVLDAQQRGVSVVLTEHSYSERGYLELFAEKLRHELDAVAVRVSAADTGPLVTL
ncbi:unnamed protein product [Ixodes persulcatus]